jgi:sialate O-acetylesterase
MRKGWLAVSGCMVMVWAVGLQAEVKAANLFGDHAVLQGGMPVPVWGTADAGERVTVKVDGVSGTATTGADGRWMVRLKKLKAGGPFEMTIAGRNTVTVKDVLVGEVWLGSGQSNMVFNVSKKGHPPYGLLDEEQEIAAANYPQIRMFTGKPTKAFEPQQEIVGEWIVCSPETVGDFSAVGYLFARDLQRELKVPVGIVLEAYGASTAEAWLPRETVAGDPRLKPLLDRFDARVSFYKAHPGGTDEGATDEGAPAGPQTLNARPGKPGPLRDPVQDQHQPTVLFNGMIQPVLPYAIRGVLWYQGESIVGGKAGVELYPHTMETLVKEWRQRWGEGQLPFYFVQLAALKNVSNNPAVREAQAQLLKVPGTAMAVTIDIGDPTNVHPKNKEPLGERLTTIALVKAYGRKGEYSGPMYESSKVEGGTVRVKFSHAAGMMAKGGELKWFQVAGADEKFVDAVAKIEGDTVVVSSVAVSAPVAVRYAWDDYPEGCNLYNGAGLPAAPFRTDTWDALTPVAARFTGK